MTLGQVYEKLKKEHALSMEKHGKWRENFSDSGQSDAIKDEFSEWYAAFVMGNVDGEHGEIAELIDLMNVAARRIMYLTGEDQ